MNLSSRAAGLASVALTFAVGVAGAQAQAARQEPDSAHGRSWIRGTVSDSLKRPVGNAIVEPLGLTVRAVTDDSGYFYLGGLPAGPREFSLRRIGFQPETFDLEIPANGGVSLELTVIETAIELEPVKVLRARIPTLDGVGFYDRMRSSADGIFVTPEEVEKRHALNASDYLEMKPGVRLAGPVGRRRVFLRNSNCEMAIFIDGFFVRSGRDMRGAQWGAFDELVMAADVYAIEIYRRAPAEFQASYLSGQAFCGAVAIWTRLYQGTGR